MTPGQFLQRIRTTAASPFTLKGKSAGLLLIFEVFVMVALAASYYFAIRPYGYYGDKWSLNTFTAYAQKNSTLPNQPELFPTWQGRLGGMLLTGALYDRSVRENSPVSDQTDRFNDTFALYHAAGLLLVFLVITCALRNSLIINLGIFAGLIYNLSPANGPNFYTWDMPAALFFTLAVILHQRRQPVLMLIVCCLGYFFKETALTPAVLLFFNTDWSWKKKVPVFFAAVAACLIAKKFLLAGMYLHTAVLSMADAHSLSGLINYRFLDRNVLTLLSTDLNHVAFANAGTFFVMLLLVDNKRFQQYSILIWLFFIGQMLYGTIKEFRIFGEVLPLSCILLLGYWKDWQISRAITPHPAALPDTAWAPRAPRAAFSVLVVFLVTLTVITVGWRYAVMSRFRSPEYAAYLFDQIKLKAQSDGPDAQLELGKHYLLGQGTPTNVNAACEWLTKAAKAGNSEAALLLARTLDQNHQSYGAVDAYYLALQLDTNSTAAMLGLAHIRATAVEPGLRNVTEAVNLSQRARQLMEHKPSNSSP